MANVPNNVPDRDDAPTNGWDTVFAINFDNANTALVSGWANVNAGAKNISQEADDDSTYNISGVFKPWQFTIGGDGKNIRMLCQFESGTYNAGSNSYDLAPGGSAAAEVEIEVGMEWVPDPNQKAFVLSNHDVPTIKTDLDSNTIDSALSAAFTANSLTLSATATARVVQAGLEWHIADGDNTYFIFYTEDKEGNTFLFVYQYVKEWKNNLKVLSESISDSQPAVVIVTIANNPVTGSVAKAVLPQLLSEWFNDKITEFNHVFADLDLAPEVATDSNFAWIAPTATSYAVTDEGSLANGIFGVLTMTGHNDPGENHQVAPNAIPTGDDANGANAGFLISGPIFVKQMLLKSAIHLFNDAPESSFQIINDHLTVTNTEALVWGRFMRDKLHTFVNRGYQTGLDAGQIPAGLASQFSLYNIVLGGAHVQVNEAGEQWFLTGTSSGDLILNLEGDNIVVYTVTTIHIQEGGFKMSLNHSYVEIEFIDLSYSYSADFDVSINYTEQIVLGLKDKGGKQIFWFDQIFRDMQVTVSKTKHAINREIIEGAISAGIALIAATGPVAEGLINAARVTEDADVALIELDQAAFQAADNADPEAAAAAEAENAQDAANQLNGRMSHIKAAFGTTKWKIVASMAGLMGVVSGLDVAITAIAEQAAKDEWEHVPGFDMFANQLIAPYTFPNVTSFDLASAWLAGSLQIGLKTK
ncbi:MAG: hypothetical protein Tsb002_15670 [Wenzhouxiangellaceae bacterium]